VDTQLASLAFAILGLWVGLAIAMATFAAAMIAAAGAASTGVGAPAAAQNGAVATGTVVALALASIGAFTSYATLIYNGLTSINQKTAANEAFPGPPGGSWPVSTQADINDGSLSDGDGTDWKMKYS
jgi:hypothetical protein